MPSIKATKASHASECRSLEQLPNVGPAMARDLELLGIAHPSQLASCDALGLYRRLELLTGQRQDPCVLDTFMAVIDFMGGAEARPWWAYTPLRKQMQGWR